MATVNNFLIDHVLRGIMLSNKDGSYMWSVNQITDPSLNVTSETSEVTDAIGTVITTFNRGKSAEFSASNSLFDLGLFAAQNGVDKEEASSTHKISTPTFETLEYTGVDTVTLAHVPTEDVDKIYLLNGDGTLGTIYTSGAEAGADKFVYDSTAHSIKFPTGLTTGTQLMAIYDYELEEGVAVTGDAINFPKAGRFIMEVLGTDTCDTTTQIHAYVEFPNAKLSSEFDLNFTSDGAHPFTINAAQSYCDSKKTLYRIIIPNEE